MMNNRLNEILRMYETGTPLEEVNALLEEEGYGSWKLDADAKKLSADEIMKGTAGLLNMGVPPYEKVVIEDGVIQNYSAGPGEIAEVWVQGEWHQVVDSNKVGPEIDR